MKKAFVKQRLSSEHKYIMTYNPALCYLPCSLIKNPAFAGFFVNDATITLRTRKAFNISAHYANSN